MFLGTPFRALISILCFLLLVSCSNMQGVKRSGSKSLPYSVDEELPAVEYQGTYEKMRGVNPAVNALLAQAKAHEADGQYDLAASKLERALRISPDVPQVHLQLANVRLKLDQAYDALQIALKGQSLLDENTQNLAKAFWRIIGDCYTRLGESSKAAEAYKHL